MPETRIFQQKMSDRRKGVHQNAFNALLNAEGKRRMNKGTGKLRERTSTRLNIHFTEKEVLSLCSSPSGCLHLESLQLLGTKQMAIPVPF